MKLTLVLFAFLMKLQQAHLSSESGTQPSSDDLMQVVLDSSHVADKRRGWGKRSVLQDGETFNWNDRPALQEGEALDSNESVIFDMIKKRGLGQRVTGIDAASTVCQEIYSEMSADKRRGWGKRDYLAEKRRGWGKREYFILKRRGWGKREPLVEKRRGWGKRDLAKKRRGWGKRDLESISSALSLDMASVTDSPICSTLQKNWYYHSCLAFKVKEAMKVSNCDELRLPSSDE